METLVLKDPLRELFSDDELNKAEKPLVDAGYSGRLGYRLDGHYRPVQIVVRNGTLVCANRARRP